MTRMLLPSLKKEGALPSRHRCAQNCRQEARRFNRFSCGLHCKCNLPPDDMPTKHFCLKDYHKWYPKTKEYTSYTMVRNPWDQFVSLHKQMFMSYASLAGCRTVPKTFKDFVLNFDEVKIEHTLATLQSRRRHDPSLVVAYQNGQDKWLEAGIDYIFRLEDLKEDITCLNDIGLEFDKKSLIKLNTSKRRANYRPYYKNDEMIEIVAEKNKKLLSLVSYEF